MGGDALIHFKDFSLTYKDQTNQALSNITLTIHKGECVVLTGASGCGKSSLLRVINHLVPTVFEGEIQGEFYIDGLSDGNPSQFVGSVLQDSKAGFLFQDLKEECIFPMQCSRIEKQEIFQLLQKTVTSNKSLFSNTDSLYLSYGQAQLLSILIQTMKKAKIIVMDEPSANLDLIEIKNLIAYIQALKQQGYTIVIAEHRVHFFNDVKDRTIYMQKGRIVSLEDTYLLRNHTFSFQNDTRFVPSTNWLCIENLNFSYREKKVLQDINLTIPSNQVIGVVGLNGVGKSTFGKVLSGLCKTKNIKVKRNQKDCSKKDLIANSFYCMQDAYKQMVTATLEDEIRLQDRSLSKAQIMDLLKSVGLDAYISNNPATLSGGQVQRLSILLAYISKKQLIILDEPTSGLDYMSMMVVIELIKKMKQQNKLIFVISHDMEFLSYCMDSYLLMDCNGNANYSQCNNQQDFTKMIQRIEQTKQKKDDIQETTYTFHASINPIVNVICFFAIVNAIFIYPYNVSSIYLFILTSCILAINRNFKRIGKGLLIYSVIFAIKPVFPLSLQVVIEIFVLRGICANMAFCNITDHTTLLELIDAFSYASLSDYILLPLVCMIRIFPTFAYDAKVCLQSLKTRGLFTFKNPIKCVTYILVPLIHALLRTSENLASGIITKGMEIGGKRTMVCNVAFHVSDALIIVLFYMMYAILILGGIR